MYSTQILSRAETGALIKALHQPQNTVLIAYLTGQLKL